MYDFRKEVFSLCKTLQFNDQSVIIREELKELITSNSENFGQGVSVYSQSGPYTNNEFHGYLFLDENLDRLSFSKLIRAEHLSEEKRYFIEQGHSTLLTFVNMCLEDIKKESIICGTVLNPYSVYKEINISVDSRPILDKSNFTAAAASFKQGKIYQALIQSNFMSLFGHMKLGELGTIMSDFDKILNANMSTEVDENIKNFYFKLEQKDECVSKYLLTYVILMCALRSSLALACRLLFRAICGLDLIVLNRDNIISIDKNVSTVLCDYYQVLAQEIKSDFTQSFLGSLLLLDCELPHKHIHEFGMPIELSITFASEFGESSKYSFVTVNEEMVFIHNLTDEILRVGLPKIRKRS